MGSTTAEVYFQREVIKSLSAAKKAIDEVIDMPVGLVRKEMHATNDQLHKSKFPITHMHMKKCINGGGRLKHNETSKAAAAILKSKEFRKMAAKNLNSCVKANLFFTSNRDLARAFYQATFVGEVSGTALAPVVTGKLVDTFDFRWGWWPKEVTIRGAKLRLAGNAAYIAQSMKLLKPVKIEVTLSGKAG